MVSRRYDRTGRMTGYTKSAKDIEAENALQNFVVKTCFILCLIALPFAPLLFISLLIYNRLHLVLGIHELFAGVIAAIPTVVGIYLLWRSRAFRWIYFGFITLALTTCVFIFVADAKDFVWATLAAGVVFVVGFLITGAIANFSFESVGEGN